MRMRLAAVFLCAAGAAWADSPQAAFSRIDRAKVPEGEARGRIETVVEELDSAGMPRSATVLLAALAADPEQSEAVRSAAKAALAARAAGDPSLAQLLLAQQSNPGKLPPALALRLARGHLERALQLAPPEEGVAFDRLAPAAPAAQAASAEVQPLDKELAAEMGQPAQNPGDTSRPSPEIRNVSPNPAQAELDRARALAGSVPADDPAGPDALEVQGLAALAAGDYGGAANEFVALAQLPAKDPAAMERRDKAYLQLARLAYQSGDDSQATALYQRVSRGAPEWLDALFEASWSRFRTGEDEKALGNLLTLHAPFFESRFFPESFVLKALVFYENCRYADARATLAEFEQRYRPLHDALSATLARLTTPQGAADFLARGPVEVQSVPAAGREEVARIEQAPDVQGAAQAAAQLAQEIDSLDKRPAVFRNSSLITRVAPLARQARIALLESAGQKLISRMGLERAELRELLGQSLRLSYEIAGREKELAVNPGAGLAPVDRKDPPQVADDEELWPFQGEYWRDELGNYRYQLGQRCKKPRAPPQTASQPQPAPERVAQQPAR